MSTFVDRSEKALVVEASERLNIPFDPEFTPGARNAVNVCLRMQPHEKVCVITDEATAEIAAAIARELEAVGARYRAWLLEDIASRPLTGMPGVILQDLE